MLLELKKKWLAGISWQDIVASNQKLCKIPETPHKPGKGFETTKQLWETTQEKEITFREAVELCRQGHDLKPFAFFNGNTMAIVSRKMVEEIQIQLPALESQIFCNSMTHYVAGVIENREFQAVCKHVDAFLKS